MSTTPLITTPRRGGGDARSSRTRESPSDGDSPALRAFLGAVDAEMGAILRSAAELQEVAVPDMAWRGGKRIRPRLVYECSLSLGRSPDEAIVLAAVAELIHAASLCHDDVVDGAGLRRGRPSLRALVENRRAVLVGDLVFSAAWSRAVRDLPPAVVDQLAGAMTRMAGAELREEELLWSPRAPWRSCVRIVDGKTAALFAASAAGAAILAGASAEAVAAMEACGQGIGRAFQILDDVQDYVPLRDGWGKEPLKDLKEGVVTLPLVIALRRGAEPAAGEVRRYLAARGERPLDPASVLALLEETSALAVTLRLARQHCRRSLAAAEPFLRADGLRRLVQALLAGLRDTPTG